MKKKLTWESKTADHAQSCFYDFFLNFFYLSVNILLFIKISHVCYEIFVLIKLNWK